MLDTEMYHMHIMPFSRRAKGVCGTSKCFYLATEKELIQYRITDRIERHLLGSHCDAPRSVVIDEASERLYTCLNHSLTGAIFVTTLDGILISTIGECKLNFPTGICLFNPKYICVCEIGRISVWNRFTCEFVKYIIIIVNDKMQMKMKDIISVGDQLLISFDNSSRIQVYDFCDGTLRHSFDIPSGKVNGMTLLDENVFIANDEVCIYRYR
jgi:hypothetical protein